MGDRTQLGELQLAIMRVLWRGEEATVAEVHQALLEERGLAPTTIATMLKKMETKGVVAHRTEGRTFVYRPIVSEGEVTRSMVSSLADRLFGGDLRAMVSHLIREHDIHQSELKSLREQIAKASAKPAHDDEERDR